MSRHQSTSSKRRKKSAPKSTQKSKEKEYNPWAPKPIKQIEPQNDQFITLEGNLIDRDFVATNIEIDIHECNSQHCKLHIYNTPYSEEETLRKLYASTSHIEHKLITLKKDYYTVECTLS